MIEKTIYGDEALSRASEKLDALHDDVMNSLYDNFLDKRGACSFYVAQFPDGEVQWGYRDKGSFGSYYFEKAVVLSQDMDIRGVDLSDWGVTEDNMNPEALSPEKRKEIFDYLYSESPLKNPLSKINEKKALQYLQNEAYQEVLSEKEAALKEYGYTWDGMLPLEWAKEATDLFEGGVPIYLLYPEGTEAEALSADDIREHWKNNGLLGVQKSDLNMKTMYVPVKDKKDLSLQEKRDMVYLTAMHAMNFEELNCEDNGQFFFDEHFPNDPYSAVVATTYGDYNYMDPFVRVNERGDIESLTYEELESEIDLQYSGIAKAYTELVNSGLNDDLGICEKQERFVANITPPVKEKSVGIRATIEANKEKAATKEPVKPSKEHAIGDDR